MGMACRESAMMPGRGDDPHPDVFPLIPQRVCLTLAGHTHGGRGFSVHRRPSFLRNTGTLRDRTHRGEREAPLRDEWGWNEHHSGEFRVAAEWCSCISRAGNCGA